MHLNVYLFKYVPHLVFTLFASLKKKKDIHTLIKQVCTVLNWSNVTKTSISNAVF